MKFIDPPIHFPRFQSDFPGWYTLKTKVMEPRLKLTDVKKYVGVTKQQLDYWIEKGVLSYQGKDPKAWRRFSLIDLFFIAIAYKLRSRGIEVSGLKQIRDGVLLHFTSLEHFSLAFVWIINGYDVFLLFDSEGGASIIPIDPEEAPKHISREDIAVDVILRKQTSFFSGLSLKKTCDELVHSLDLPDFKVNILSDGSYKFIINEVPLELETLQRKDIRKRFPETETFPSLIINTNNIKE